MTRMTRKLGFALLLVGGLALAGCGGDDDHSVTSQVPSSASENAEGFIDYLMKLVVASADDLEPVDVSTIVAPIDDMAEPTTLQ